MDGHRSLALTLAAGMLSGLGSGTLGLAICVIRDHGRKRAQQAAAGKWTRNVV
jgi:hypothetical protein